MVEHEEGGGILPKLLRFSFFLCYYRIFSLVEKKLVFLY